MGANRRFFALATENSIFEFTIDTRNIVVGATNGSENPLTFRFPIAFPNSDNNFIVRVSDGRPDFLYIPNPSGLVLTFATAGIYTISLIGRVLYFNPNTGSGTDKLKFIEINRWGNVSFGNSGAFSSFSNSFLGCSNLTIKATNSIKLPDNCSNAFNGIKGFDPSVDLAQYDASDVTILSSMFANITLPLYSVLNPFFNKATNLTSLYDGNNMSNVPKIEIIAPLLTNVQGMLRSSGFQGELIINAPLTGIYGLLENVANPPSLGKVDIRKLRTTNSFQRFITSTMSTANVNTTLLGWVNNFNWSGVTVISPTCSINFRSSKYSNNPAVIAAKTFLESKGYVFTNLTMA